jgi:hypothetical protein
MPRHFPEASRGRVGRPLSPERTLERLEAVRTAMERRPDDLQNWTDEQLEAVVKAARALAAPFQNELEDRWHRRGLEDD